MSYIHLERTDEEGLLKNIQISELSLKISKLTFGWDNHVDPIKQAQILVHEVQKISLEVSEYGERMSSNLSGYQRDLIYKSMDDLEKLLPQLKKKITPSKSTEEISSNLSNSTH